MVKVVVCSDVVVLVSVPEILPVPLAGIPVTLAVLFLVQLYTVPATLPVRAIVVIGVPEQIVCDAGVATALGIGFTVMVAVTGVPLHPLADGVMVKTTTCGTFVVLVSDPEIVPVPDAAIPVTFTLLSLVQLNTVPATGPVRVIGAMAEPEQMVCGASGSQPGIPLTVSVPTLGHGPPLPVALIQPDATTAPLHLTSQRQALSLKNPWASMKNSNGALVAGTSADGVGGGLNP